MRFRDVYGCEQAPTLSAGWLSRLLHAICFRESLLACERRFNHCFTVLQVCANCYGSMQTRATLVSHLLPTGRLVEPSSSKLPPTAVPVLPRGPDMAYIASAVPEQGLPSH